MRHARKTLLVGVDSAEWTLIRRWMEEGRLPNFQRICDGGAQGILESSAAMLPDTVWDCVYGGRNPATFEKYFYIQYDHRTGDLRHLGQSRSVRRPFWDILAAAGLRVGVFDAEQSLCSDELGPGFMLVGWALTFRDRSAGLVHRSWGERYVGDSGRAPCATSTA